MKIDRRDFMRRTVGASGAVLLGSIAGGGISRAIGNRPDPASLPDPSQSGIKHIVVVTMENRSFDHFLGWLPNPPTQIFPYPVLNNTNVEVSTYPLAPDYQGCGHPDPDHSYQGGRVEWNDGAMNGWLLDENNDIFSIGYYNQRDIPFFGTLATKYTTLGNYICSVLGPTYPNRIFMLAGQTDRLDNTLSLVSLPTIFDELYAAGVSARYYYSNLPFVALWGLKYLPISRTYDQFLDDAVHGRLPAVSFVDPRFTILDDDLANDDVPHTNIRRGDAFLARTFKAVARGPAWPSTVFIITFDEWGGFFDHIAPPRVVAPNGVDPDSADGVLLGFRVPAIIASPWTRTNSSFLSDERIFDHTSILKLIEWRWGLPPLTARDGSSEIGNLADVLDFSNKITRVPRLPTPRSPLPSPCFLQGLAPSVKQRAQVQVQVQTPWLRLSGSSLMEGWPVKKQ
ncbi:MAG: alkaline phosphatase family protein [Acidobacteriota bacterium]